MKERLGTTAYNYVEEEELRSTKSKRNAQVLPRFELGLEESEPSVITDYTIGPLFGARTL